MKSFLRYVRHCFSMSNQDRNCSALGINISFGLLVLGIFLILLCPAVSASYSGNFISATAYTPLAIGDTLYFDVVVQNTGTDTWLGQATYPYIQSWYVLTTGSYGTMKSGPVSNVVGGAQTTYEESLGPSYLPTVAGNYTQGFGLYYNASTTGTYYQMTNSPQSVPFTLSNIVDNTWTKSAGTWNWDDRKNWSNRNRAFMYHNAKFTNAGIISSATINVGGTETINALVFDSSLDFSLGGSSGSLSLISGQISRTTSSAGTQTITRPVILDTNGVWNIGGSGQLAISGAISGGYFLQKTGAGILKLSGANTYNQSTQVKNGTLILAGGSSTSSAFSVDAGAVLENSATSYSISGNVTNLGTLLVDSGSSLTFNMLSGSGNTQVAGSMTATSIVQNQLSISSGGMVTIQPISGGKANMMIAGVPEPGSFVLLLMAVVIGSVNCIKKLLFDH